MGLGTSSIVMSPVLEIRLLGPGSFTAITGEPAALEGRTGSLLACLALHRGRNIPRKSLACWLWDDLAWSSARNRLNTTLHRLRAQIEPDPAQPRFIVSASRNELSLSRGSGCWLDVEVFESTVSQLTVDRRLNAEELDTLEGAATLYSGELCVDTDADWVAPTRARLANLALAARTRLAEECLARESVERAAQHARAALEIDDLREDLHRLIIRCHLKRGDRAGALAHFEHLKQLLADELDVTPMPETMWLISGLWSPEPTSQQLVDARSLLASLQAVRNELLGVVAGIDAAMIKLDHDV